jgi:citrate synthase
MSADQVFSPGLAGVIGAETAVGSVDGAAGRLLYRGYPIEELVTQGTYASVVDLLLTGEWHPNAELTPVGVPPTVLAALRLLPAHAHPMDALRTAISVWGAGERLGWPPTAEEAKRIIAFAPSALAAFARLRQGLEPINPEPGLHLAAAFLQQLHGKTPDPATARALDAYLMAGAEHGLNASTFAGRVIIATRSDIASAICGAIGAMKGPLHGGAPAEVIGQLGEIGSVDRAEDWARGKLNRHELIMGFGHRVYRAYDPRAAALRKVAEAMPNRPDWLDLAIGAEEVILRVFEEMKPGRAMKTNVEFYAAAVLQGVGLVPDLFPATFAIARIAGWSAHAIEQAGVDKLIRPDARYIGHAERHLPA